MDICTEMYEVGVDVVYKGWGKKLLHLQKQNIKVASTRVVAAVHLRPVWGLIHNKGDRPVEGTLRIGQGQVSFRRMREPLGRHE